MSLTNIKKKQVLLFVPTGVDIKNLMGENGYSQRQINDHLDKYHYFLHLIYTGTLYRYDIEESNGFTRINDEILNNFLGRYRKLIKDNLIKWGIIYSDNHYITGRKSKGYKIAPPYAVSYRTEVCINDTFEKNLRNKNSYFNTLKGSEQYLYDMLQQVGIKAEEAHSYIENKLANSLHTLRGFGDSRFTNYQTAAATQDLYELNEHLSLTPLEVLEKNINDRFNADLLAINTIDNGMLKLTVDKYGRVHTPLTNMSRKLRQFLINKRHPEQALYNLDLSCSQPFFLNILLKESFRFATSLPVSVEQYIQDTSTGLLYERVMIEAGIAINETNRRNFKESFFGDVFYCSNHTAGLKSNTVARAFERLYPEVYGFISKRKEVDFREFSRLMQKAESTAIIGHAVQMAQMQGVWVSTIHDSTIVLEQDVQTMYTIIETVFREVYDLNPNIKEEAVTPVTVTQPVLATTTPEAKVISFRTSINSTSMTDDEFFRMLSDSDSEPMAVDELLRFLE
ncbi:hypothetical protein EFA69_06520 [Rufibacter immobilis]|uniref:DNA-directed DNA polymerase family A palm domain-containing protein n=1 Tax=Rufibacter immobilis TaxID=1348778 RepID=A0A3M9MZF9_9BACT|nr:hypothetical protein [Rufibacter immobilis]RNI30941.1 hypothetical protein EFA69_06520 [Rufibacter immobilis]